MRRVGRCRWEFASIQEVGESGDFGIVLAEQASMAGLLFRRTVNHGVVRCLLCPVDDHGRSHRSRDQCTARRIDGTGRVYSSFGT